MLNSIMLFSLMLKVRLLEMPARLVETELSNKFQGRLHIDKNIKVKCQRFMYICDDYLKTTVSRTK